MAAAASPGSGSSTSSDWIVLRDGCLRCDEEGLRSLSYHPALNAILAVTSRGSIKVIDGTSGAILQASALHGRRAAAALDPWHRLGFDQPIPPPPVVNLHLGWWAQASAPGKLTVAVLLGPKSNLAAVKTWLRFASSSPLSLARSEDTGGGVHSRQRPPRMLFSCPRFVTWLNDSGAC